MELKPLNLPAVNGTAPASALSPEAATSTQKFHNSKPPARVLVEEKPWHFAAALMFARGEVSGAEVARAFDVSPPTIYNLMRQDWFQARVTQLMAEHGARDIMQLFRAESWQSLVTLVELRDDPKVPSTVRSSNAKDILDRALGKPIQRIETSGPVHSDDPVAEARRLEEENERRRAALSAPV